MGGEMFTIAQITDLHIGATGDPLNNARNERRLRQVLGEIHALRPRPAAIIASGDLCDPGLPGSYVALRAILQASEIPIHLAIGNHDDRAALVAAFPPAMIRCDANGFVQYAVDIGPLRVIVCDTVEAGSHEGAFCTQRADWLTRTLAEAPDRPTRVVLHHPPVPSGIQWMDPEPGADWIGRLETVLKGRSQIQGVICGHVHRAYHAPFAGQALHVSAATSLQLVLNLTAVDRRTPDGREILRGEPPGFTLLAWDGARLATHSCVAGDWGDVITYEKPFDAH